MLRLYIMRHGEAATRQGESEPSLTHKGEREVASVADWLAASGIAVVRIVHSGKRRARQTAEIVASKLAPERGVEAREGLAPNDDVYAIGRDLESERDPLLVVSHLPLVAHLVGLLVENDPEGSLTGFSTAEVACLERSGGEWRLQWTKRPDELGRY